MEGDSVHLRLHRKHTEVMGVIFRKSNLLALLLAAMLLPALASAKPGDAKKGEEIYQKRCWWCHGEEGAGDGPASEFLRPPPRDFTMGIYKFKSTPFEEIIPSDADFMAMIKGGVQTNHIPNWEGMNDSSMPGWGDLLSDDDIWDLVAYIKGIVEYEQPEEGPLDFSKKVASSPESIAKGKTIFEDICAECHGELGRGDGSKSLKDDAGFRTWPRNLSKPWSFRMTNGPEGIYTRLTASIQGTQMPSLADPVSKKKLSEEERWNVANYAASLEAPYKKPGDNTVVQGLKVEGEVPAATDDPIWETATITSFFMIPQIIKKERYFTPSINSISVRAAYNSKEIAFLLEWDDRTMSVPGDEKAAEIADEVFFNDSVAIQFPVEIPSGTEKPYFIMGDATRPVNFWQWTSQSSDKGQSLALINAKGMDKTETRNIAEAGLTSQGKYDKGTWRVVIKRPLATEQKDKDIQIVEGKFIPIAFAAWDGSNGETGSKRVMTTWHWLFLKPETGTGVYLWPIIIALLIFGGELLLLRNFRKK